MSAELNTLRDVCGKCIWQPKWLLTPSQRTGAQWVELVVRGGQPALNLRPATPLRLALDLIGGDLAAEGLEFAGRPAGRIIVDTLWRDLPADGYFGKLAPTPNLTAIVYDALRSLRSAGCRAEQLGHIELESDAKAADMVSLLAAYNSFLHDNKLFDEADALRRAIAFLKRDLFALEPDTIVLICRDVNWSELEEQLIAAIPLSRRRAIEHPLQRLPDGGPAAAQSAAVRCEFFRAVGESNEVREVFRRCLSEGISLDDVEVIHSHAETYVSLLYEIGRRYFSDPDRPEGAPITFADGVPAAFSRPGRALAFWLQWIQEGYPQRLLVDAIGSGLLETGDSSTQLGSLVRILRPLAIGGGAGKYLPNIDEQISALRSAAEPNDSEGDAQSYVDRRIQGLQTLRRLVAALISLSSEFVELNGAAALGVAEQFLAKRARAVNELDRYAGESMIEQLQDRRSWLSRLKLRCPVAGWLRSLPAQTRVMGSGPRPGHLHVAPISSGGNSGRQHTFVVGLDDRRFPGVVSQDPILLDAERRRLSSALPTSGDRLTRRLADLTETMSRLTGRLTISWTCHDVGDDREVFASSVALDTFRKSSGESGGELVDLDAAAGPPVSFAPDAAEKALDESEWWLWRLSQADAAHTDQLAIVEDRYSHLVRGRAAERQRLSEFGPFSGHVPRAGEELNPFSPSAPVLSASLLETAGRCPLAFFFRRALGLYPLDEWEPDPDRWLDAAQTGLLLHEVFRRFLSEISEQELRPQFERDHQRLADILRSAVDDWRKMAPPSNEYSYRTQYWQLIRIARIFLDAEEEYCRSSQPQYFEVAVGMDNSVAGPLDDPAPAVVSLPSGGSIRVRGQVDRVDIDDDGAYSVWDYKIGSGFGYEAANPFRQGRRVQSVLYMSMVESLLAAQVDSEARVGRFGYFFPSLRAGGKRMSWTADELRPGRAVLESLCSAIAAGAFIASDEKKDCAFCDYAAICRDTLRATDASRRQLSQPDTGPLLHIQQLRPR